MKKVLLATIFAGAVAFAGEANATAPAADANATAAKAAPAAAAKGDAAAGKIKFAACAGCHGQKGERKALGKSVAIGGWDAAKVEEALKGYKAGTRNKHGMGATMKGQTAALSDADIANLAAYISTLK